MLDIPSPTNINPKEFTITFIAIESNVLPNNAEIKKPIKIKAPDNCNTRCFPYIR